MFKKKKIGVIIASLVLLIGAISAVSYSIATLQNPLGAGEDAGGTTSGSGNLDIMEGSYISNIDIIIENSHRDISFNVVEILPNGINVADSSLKSYITNGSFAQYVLTNNSEQNQTMNANMISYVGLNVGAGTELSHSVTYVSTVNSESVTQTIQEVLDNADLIYLSSPAYTSYTGTDNNMSESVYNWLHTYALGSNKPLMMDYVTPSSTTEVTSITYKSFAESVKTNHIRYKTFYWNSSLSLEQFLTLQGDTYYKKFNVNTSTSTGKVLIISNDETGGALKTTLEGFGDANWKSKAYWGLNDNMPDAMSFEVMTPTQVEAAYTAGTFPGTYSYDFMFLDDSVSSATMSQEVLDSMKALSLGGKYIIYPKAWVDANASDVIDPDASNYLKLMSLLFSNQGLSLYGNVMKTSYGYFGPLVSAGESGQEAANQIAKLIDDSNYRGNSSKKGKLFTVLELEPCYPIDQEVANSRPTTVAGWRQQKFNLTGNYYEEPSEVMLGVTKDEVPANTEYYKFDVSKAMIAHATGLAFNQIKVVTMSTEEFITSKDVALETYDLIYIGGNYSALTPYDEYEYIKDAGSLTYARQLAPYMSAYQMYTHTGAMVPYESYTSNNTIMTGRNNGSAFTGYGVLRNQAGTRLNTYVELNGNDITTTKYEELVNYVNAGMPVIVEKHLAESFEESYAFDPGNRNAANPNRMKQLALKYIDPDSNMYKLLAFIYESDNAENRAVDNVEWGIHMAERADDTESPLQKIANDEQKYGTTPMVTVLKDGEGTPFATKVKNLINQSKTRPTLVVESAPKDYVEGNTNTYNTERSLVVSSTVKPSSTNNNFTLALYVDIDGDGVFSDGAITDGGECSQVASFTYTPPENATGNATAANNPVSLHYDLEDDFYGLISWKVVATEQGGRSCDISKGYAYYKRPEEMEKKKVKILQIMPVETYQTLAPEKLPDGSSNPDFGTYIQSQTWGTNYGENDGHSLYYCTECQQAGYRAFNNIIIGGNISQNTTGSESTNAGVNVGLHEHKFGIVKYDSGVNDEDWENNLADTLSDDYEFDLDIMTVPEFEYYVTKVNELIENSSSTEGSSATSAATQLAAFSEAAYQIGGDDGTGGQILEKTMELATSGYEAELQTQLRAMIGNTAFNMTQADTIEEWIRNREYYKFWEYNNGYGNGNNAPQTLKDAYNNYIAKYDEIVKLKQKYKYYSKLAASTDWISMNYNMVVLGFAEDFGGLDISEAGCQQIKSFVKKGGTLLNTHDSTSRYSDAGAKNITNLLRETFGMDRYHVTGVASSLASSLSVTPIHYTDATYGVGAQTLYFKINGDGNSMLPVEVTNRDCTVAVTTGNEYYGYDASSVNQTVSETVHENSEDSLTISVTLLNSATNGPVIDGRPIEICTRGLNEWGGYQYTTIASATTVGGVCTFEVPQAIVQLSDGNTTSNPIPIQVPSEDTEYNLQLTADSAVITPVTTPPATPVEGEEAAAPTAVTVKYHITDPLGQPIPEGTVVSLTLNGTATPVAADATGTVTFAIPLGTSANLYTVEDESIRYRQFITKDNTKYFFTDRRAGANYSNTAAWQADLHSIITWNQIGYNSPVGLTDAVAIFETTSRASSPYRYVEYNMQDAIHWNQGYRIKKGYGTNRASQTNKGIVTVYPFTLSSELIISGTHAQTYALDMEDTNVSVWYTLAGGTTVRGADSSAPSAKSGSSLFAASPHDGMDAYYLYSKGNVFYCGAGNSVVTGPERDNNDERRLFINIVVNSVRNAKPKPKLRLYNKDSHTNDCDHNLVDKMDSEANEAASQELNTLFYNEATKQYQYNVDSMDAWPEFDLKAIEGAGTLTELRVFYDLNYGASTEDHVNNSFSNDYTEDDDHVLVASYTESDNFSGKRIRLSQANSQATTGEGRHINNLQLQQRYFDNYGSYTYLVIYVRDDQNQTRTERVKINLIPKLFDLTDAGFDYPVNHYNPWKTGNMDMIDKKRF